MLRKVLGAAAGHFDRAMTMVIAARSRQNATGAAERLRPTDRLHFIERFRTLYDNPDYLTKPETFFTRRGPLEPVDTAVRSYGSGGRVVELRWPSRSEPLCADVAAAYLACDENRTVVARLFAHNDRPRPAVILIHGYLGGAFRLEERVWPVRWLFDRGLDVALAVLPFHGVRANVARGGSPIFPGPDPRITVEGFRQAIIDLQDLHDVLRARGAPAVGAVGMSLGGYSTALLATVEPALAFAVPMIPLASVTDVARDQGRLTGTESEKRRQYDGLNAIYHVVSPFARSSRLPPERLAVIAAEGDRITPVAHARRLAEHFGVPLETFAGGHLLQFGRADAFRSVARLAGRLGLLERRR